MSRTMFRTMQTPVALCLLAVVAAAALHGAQGASAKRPSGPTAARRPSKPGVGVRQQGDEYVDPEVIKEVFTSTPKSADRYLGQGQEPAPGDDVSQEFICSVFGGPSCPESTPIASEPCTCENGDSCMCVPYYQCDKSSGSFNEFGVGVIDIRQGNSSGCSHYLTKCCKTAERPGKTPDPYPSNPDPYQPKPVDQPTTSSYPDPYPSNPDPYPSNPDPYPSNPSPDPYPSNPKPDPYPSNPDPYPSNPNPDPYPSNPDPYPSNPVPDDIPKPSPPYQQGGPARCGQRNPEGIGVRITGDEDGEAQFGEFPWMVAILKVETSDDEKKRNLYQCGGALITPQVVITAAHCVKPNSPRQLKVRAGEWDTQTSKEMYRHQDIAVEDVIIHPDYYAGAVHNDIALLFLNDPVHVGYHIGTICMPEQDYNFDYQKCFVSGWGKDKFGQQGRYQVILKKLELPMVPHEECQEQLRKTRLGNYFTLHHSFVCAGGEEGKDTCKGDGGSPLVCPIPGLPGRYQLAGTVAWGIDCGLPGVPGVYGKVSMFRNWVDEQLRSHHIDDSSYRP